MNSKSLRDNAKRELVELRNLAKLFEGNALMGLQFTVKIQQLEEFIGQPFNKMEPRTSVFFNGEPVNGTFSIDAKFATQALDPLLEAIKTEYALAVAGQVGERGRRKDESLARLMIAGTPRGSFGFELVAPPFTGDLFAEEQVVNAMKTLAKELELSITSDDTYLDLIEMSSSRVFGNLKDFFAVLRKYNAGFELESNEFTVSANVEQVRDTYRRFHDSQQTEDFVKFRGVFRGGTVDSRQFNFRVGDDLYRGRIDDSVEEDAIVEMFSNINRECEASMRVITTVTPNGNTRNKYLLTQLSEL